LNQYLKNKFILDCTFLQKQSKSKKMLNLILHTTYIILSVLTLLFLTLPFWNVLLSRFFPERKPQATDEQYDFGCIITAYRNAAIAKPLVESLLRQSHPKLHVYLVADACEKEDFGIQDERLTVLFPNPALNLKAKSIIHATEHFQRKHDYTVIFDADNLAHPDFLQELNRYAAAGHRSIQGQRTAKNLDTFYACADALGEFYKNYIERYVPYLLGSSSVISGSGMAVESDLYQAYLQSPAIQKGQHLWKRMLQEDKILQNFLLDRGERIVYAWDAVVYDEKVTTAQAVETQRSRWLYSYFQNVPNSLRHLANSLRKMSWNRWLFGWITIAPPLFIQLLAAFVLAMVGLFVQPWMSVALVLGVGIFAGTILWTLRLSKVPQQVWRAVWKIPAFVLQQVKGLLKMGNPNKNFKHTEHDRSVSIDDVLNSK